MISLDIIKTKATVASIDECVRMMKRNLDCVDELVRQTNNDGGLHRVSRVLDGQYMELQELSNTLRQFKDCLEDTIVLYEERERKNLTYIEEIAYSLRLSDFIEYIDIPTHIFALLG